MIQPWQNEGSFNESLTPGHRVNRISTPSLHPRQRGVDTLERAFLFVDAQHRLSLFIYTDL
jgi:hypothetical protein